MRSNSELGKMMSHWSVRGSTNHLTLTSWESELLPQRLAFGLRNKGFEERSITRAGIPVTKAVHGHFQEWFKHAHSSTPHMVEPDNKTSAKQRTCDDPFSSVAVQFQQWNNLSLLQVIHFQLSMEQGYTQYRLVNFWTTNFYLQSYGIITHTHLPKLSMLIYQNPAEN